MGCQSLIQLNSVAVDTKVEMEERIKLLEVWMEISEKSGKPIANWELEIPS